MIFGINIYVDWRLIIVVSIHTCSKFNIYFVIIFVQNNTLDKYLNIPSYTLWCIHLIYFVDRVQWHENYRCSNWVNMNSDKGIILKIRNNLKSDNEETICWILSQFSSQSWEHPQESDPAVNVCARCADYDAHDPLFSGKEISHANFLMVYQPFVTTLKPE